MVRGRTAPEGPPRYTTPDLGSYLSGVILSADMLFEETAEGVPFVDLLSQGGVVPGVRVDAGDARPRRLLALELPWAADAAVQQLGRIHRSKKSAPPSYVLLVPRRRGGFAGVCSVAYMLFDSRFFRTFCCVLGRLS